MQKAQHWIERWITVIIVLVQKLSYQMLCHRRCKRAPVDNWKALPNSMHCGAVLHLSQKHAAFIPVSGCS